MDNKNICNHMKDKIIDGQSLYSLTISDDDKIVCVYCGAEFNPLDFNDVDIVKDKIRKGVW